MSASLEHPPALRESFVENQCGDDAQLRTLILNLLSLNPAGDVAARGLDEVGAEVALGSTGYLGPVRLLEKVGQGGMGVVYRAKDIVLNRPVAVKLVSTERAGGALDLDRFLREARAAAQVSHGKHENLTEVYFANVAGSVPFLVFEYVDGPSVAELLKRMGRLPVAVAVEILKSICEGVAALHRENIVHRDIKPSNVLVGQDGVVRVSDFGLALLGVEGVGGQRTRAVAGTPEFMAPEMFEGDASMRSDVYALGITAFQLLSGQLPFFGSAQDLAFQHRERELPLELLVQQEIPEPIIDVVQRATDKRLIYRYKSAAELGRALQIAAEAAKIPGANSALLSMIGIAGSSPTMNAPPVKRESISTTIANLLSLKKERKQKEAVQAAGARDINTIDGDLACLRCQRDIAGRSMTTECPDCGLRISMTQISAFCNRAGVEWPLTIDFHLGCGQCGYDLFMLSSQRECPECGKSSTETLREHLDLLKRQSLIERLGRELSIFAGILAFAAAIFALMLFYPQGLLSARRSGLFIAPGPALSWPVLFVFGMFGIGTWNSVLIRSARAPKGASLADPLQVRVENPASLPPIVGLLGTLLLCAAWFFLFFAAIFENHNSWAVLQASPGMLVLAIVMTLGKPFGTWHNLLLSFRKHRHLVLFAVATNLGVLVSLTYAGPREAVLDDHWLNPIVQAFLFMAAGVLLITMISNEVTENDGYPRLHLNNLWMVFCPPLAFAIVVDACLHHKWLSRPFRWQLAMIFMFAGVDLLLTIGIPAHVLPVRWRDQLSPLVIPMQVLLFTWCAIVFHRMRRVLWSMSVSSHIPAAAGEQTAWRTRTVFLLLGLLTIAFVPKWVQDNARPRGELPTSRAAEFPMRMGGVISTLLLFLALGRLGALRIWHLRSQVPGFFEAAFVQDIKVALTRLKESKPSQNG